MSTDIPVYDDKVRRREDAPYLEERCRGYIDRIFRAMSACSAEGLRIERTGNIKIFVGRDVALDFRLWGRQQAEARNMIEMGFRYPNSNQIGTLGGLDLVEDERAVMPSSIVLHYDIVV